MILVRTLFLVLCLGLFNFAAAQPDKPGDFEFEKDGKKYFYFNSDEKLIDNENNAAYYRQATRLDNGFWKFNDYFSGSDKVRRSGIKENPNPLFTGGFRGEVSTYFENGSVEELAVYDDKSFPIDEYVLNHENGERKEAGRYVGGMKQGDWKTYYDNGKVKSEKRFEMGLLSGSVQEYYESGAVKQEAEYILLDDESVKNGEEIHYYENGGIKSQILFQEGNAQDKHAEFHENGEAKITGQYDEEGNKTGTWKEFYDNGSLLEEKHYEEGVLVRQGERFHKNGKLAMKVESVEGGAFNGPYKRFFDNGEPAEIGKYEEGEKKGIFKSFYKVNGFVKTVVNHTTGEKRYFNEKGEETSAPHRVDEIPEKDKKLIKTINKNLEIPDKHKTVNRGVYGFTVTRDGKIVNAKVLTSADDFVDAAAIKALNKIEIAPAVKNDSPAEVKNAVVIFFDKKSKKYDMVLGNYYVDLEGSDENFAVVEEMPMFKGGENELFSFLSQNITYPSAAKNQGFSGVVYINFIVDKSGVILSPRVLRGIHPTLDLAAMYCIEKMPVWDAGLQREAPVLVSFNLPIRFTLR